MSSFGDNSFTKHYLKTGVDFFVGGESQIFFVRNKS